MSYSLSSKCGQCIKEGKCTDKNFIEGAISGIHSVWPSEKGHLGSGIVFLDCQNFEEKE